MRGRTRATGIILGGIAALMTAGAAQAGDGVIEINHAAALAGGVTSSDTPGYPVTLVPGASYRLTSDLRIGSADLDVIDGAVPTVLGQPNTNGALTLDLNGFSVRCFTGAIIIIGQTCAGNGIGINLANIDLVTVKNGTVRGMGADGLRLGDEAIVENVRAIGNGDFMGGNIGGIYCGENCSVRGSVAVGNGRYGIFTGGHSTVTDSRAESNDQAGMRLGGYSLATGNVVYDNDYHGIVDSSYGHYLQNQISQNGSLGIDALTGGPFTYGHNTLIGNNGGGAQVDFSGTQVETNYCQNNTVCP